MNIEKYPLRSDGGATFFTFVSEGPKGFIEKGIQFQPTEYPGIYNLAFGDLDHLTCQLDDMSISNNGDSDKVLATVIAALYKFFDQHPGTIVYAVGSTPARTRLTGWGSLVFMKKRSKILNYMDSKGMIFLHLKLTTITTPS